MMPCRRSTVQFPNFVSDHGGGSGLGVRRLPADPRALPVGGCQGGRVRLEVPAGNSCDS